MEEDFDSENESQEASDSIELGGNITLKGFDSVEPAKLIVVKKMVGNYARQISNIKEFSNLTLEYKDNKIHSVLKIDGKEIKADSSENNLYFGINECLNKVIKEVK